MMICIISYNLTVTYLISNLIELFYAKEWQIALLKKDENESIRIEAARRMIFKQVHYFLGYCFSNK